ncbi:MAG: crossover junction endodeoxyribonuclease RuvC [Parachlamydiaceae bacterium]|nr:crossover junction endodeoxyribonuclease RuvC [Parachlamydiaceae bacterium]
MKDKQLGLKEEIILGIDPGTQITGYGLILIQGNQYIPIDFGCIRTPVSEKLSNRYLIIFNALEELIERYKPTEVVVETQYIQKNVQSALKLGMARGIVMMAAKKWGLPIYGYSPTEAKRSVVGNGSASKFQVQGMVQKLLKLLDLPTPMDAADALALAICHAHCASHLKDKHEI